MIPILKNIDANTKALLDVFSVGVTGGHFAKSLLKSQKKAERAITQDLPDIVSAVVQKAAAANGMAKTSSAAPPPPAIKRPVQQSNETPERKPVALDSNPEKQVPKSVADIKPDTLPKTMVSRQPLPPSPPPFSPSKSQQALVESRQKAQQDALRQIVQKQESRLGKLARPLVDMAKEQLGGHKNEITDTAGLAVGGPFYAAAQELSGLGSELKDIYTTVREKGGDKAKDGGKASSTGGRDAFGRYLPKNGQETTEAVITQSGEKTVSATQDVKIAVEKSEKADQKRHRELIQALLADSSAPQGNNDTPIPTDEGRKKSSKGKQGKSQGTPKNETTATKQGRETAPKTKGPSSFKSKASSRFSSLKKRAAGGAAATGGGGTLGAVGDVLGAVGDAIPGGETGGVATKIGGKLSKGLGKAGSVGGKLVRGLGGAFRIAGKIAGPLAAMGTAVDALQGFSNTREIQQIFNTREAPTTGQRVANSVANVIDFGGLTTAFANMLGMGFDKSDITKTLYGAGKFLSDSIPEKPLEIAANTLTDSGNPADNQDVPFLTETKGWKGFVDFFTKTPDLHIPDSSERLVGKTDATINPRAYVPDVLAQSHETLGSLSAKYESGKRGAATVSSGKGDIGGVSYGTYQMASKGGDSSTAAQFVKQSKWADQFKGLKAGSSEFSDKWKQVAANDTEFATAQHDYIKQTHYDPMMEQLNQAGIDLSARPKAVQDVLWSRAVHHGAGNGARVVEKALGGVKDVSSLSDEELINRIYDESGKKNASGELAYFKGNSASVQAGVSRRFENERKDAIAALHQPPTEIQKPMLASADVTHKTIEQPKDIQPPVQPDGQAMYASNQAMIDKQMAYFDRMNNSRPTPPSQPNTPGYNIPMEFDDALLTLMAYDRV
ncbi:hypothetical protein [Desulfatirhabdium butyrativorans]|uniref:VgrG-related protein n=1 Tax=Desulfatirhabdium butyrativorans TaxID=340467 RepID=UPI00146FB8E3|nr:hypothetical protein [Desulfatirhabdium butyrativorans]